MTGTKIIDPRTVKTSYSNKKLWKRNLEIYRRYVLEDEPSSSIQKDYPLTRQRISKIAYETYSTLKQEEQNAQ